MKLRFVSVASIVGLAHLTPACSGGGGAASTELAATVREFQFSPSTWTVPAGQDVSNRHHQSGNRAA